MGSICGYYKHCEDAHEISEIKDSDELISSLLKKWTEQAEKVVTSYCPLKFVAISFMYKGVFYKIYPQDINTDDNTFEHLSRTIENDLVAIDCDDVFYSGMID